MIKSWKLFNESLTKDYHKHFNYTQEELDLVEKIRKLNIKQEYDLYFDLDRFDKNGLPLVDIYGENNEGGIIIDYDEQIGTYNIKRKQFSIWRTQRMEKTTERPVLGLCAVWDDIVKSENMKVNDNGILVITGEFFDEIERFYYIYYQ